MGPTKAMEAPRVGSEALQPNLIPVLLQERGRWDPLHPLSLLILPHGIDALWSSLNSHQGAACHPLLYSLGTKLDSSLFTLLSVVSVPQIT